MTEKQSGVEVGGVINVYTPVVEILKPCTSEISVKSSEGFFVGDKILIMQMQGAIIDSTNSPLYGTVLDRNSSGSCEFCRITKISGNKITVKNPLVNTYSVDGNVQLIRVPEYDDAILTGELTCKPWDGSTGGVVALCVYDTLYMKKNINVSGKGFRGGAVYIFSIYPGHYVSDYTLHKSNLGYGAAKGEGIAQYGVFPYINGRGAAANGGGGGANHNAGGAGGGNAGCGGDGGEGWKDGSFSGNNKDAQSIGGKPLDYTSQGIFMGGGGGSGHSNEFSIGKGGNGGGIVILLAGTVYTTDYAQILSNGERGEQSVKDGSGGSGAGGTVYLDVQSITPTTTISVRGADGANNLCEAFDVPPGGGGGGGAVMYAASGKTILTNVSGGKSGKTVQGNTYGAKEGCSGKIIENRKIAESNEQALDIDVNNDTTICFGESVALNARGADRYEWSPSEGLNKTDISNPIAKPTKTTKYFVKGIKENCDITDSVVITVYTKSDLTLNNDTSICYDDSVQLFVGGADRYEWSPADYLDNPFIANPIAKPEKSIIYTVTGMKGNCIETKTVEIKVQPVYNAQIVLSTSDTVKYGAGTRVPVRVIIPSGLNNAEFGIHHDKCCLLFERILSADIPYTIKSKNDEEISFTIDNPTRKGGVIELEYTLLLPPDARLKEKITLHDVITADKCTKVEGKDTEIEYEPGCAWNIRGVQMGDKFDITVQDEKVIINTGLGGKTSISIYEMTGQELWKTEQTFPISTEAEVSLPQLSSGAYILRVQNYNYKKDVVLVK